MHGDPAPPVEPMQRGSRLSAGELRRLSILRESAIDLDIEADDLREEIQRLEAGPLVEITTAELADRREELARNGRLMAVEVQVELRRLIAKGRRDVA